MASRIAPAAAGAAANSAPYDSSLVRIPSRSFFDDSVDDVPPV
jgi:hypothetical protein